MAENPIGETTPVIVNRDERGDVINYSAIGDFPASETREEVLIIIAGGNGETAEDVRRRFNESVLKHVLTPDSESNHGQSYFIKVF